jgi:hypothetical protein
MSPFRPPASRVPNTVTSWRSSPRRLGKQQQVPGRPGAARRYGRNHGGQSRWKSWGAIALVVVVLAVFLVVKLTGSPTTANLSAVDSGQHPQLAPAAYVDAMTTIPLVVYDSVGTDQQPEPFTATKNQPGLTSAGLPQFVYEGGEFCPYCAMMRYSLVAALSRFGTFKNLKETTSGGSGDGQVPTFSFLGSTYTSRYLVFTPIESEDREEPPQPLQQVPAYVANLYAKYDGVGTVAAEPFNSGGAGIPFLDLANRYVSAGDPASFASLWLLGGPLYDGGPGRQAIAEGIRNPSSGTGKYINGAGFIAEANYLSAAICSVDGRTPTAVCASPGVVAASRVIAAARSVS